MTRVMPQIFLRGFSRSMAMVDNDSLDADFDSIALAQAYFEKAKFVAVMMRDDDGFDDHVELISTSMIERIDFMEMEEQ